MASVEIRVPQGGGWTTEGDIRLPEAGNVIPEGRRVTSLIKISSSE